MAKNPLPRRTPRHRACRVYGSGRLTLAVLLLAPFHAVAQPLGLEAALTQLCNAGTTLRLRDSVARTTGPMPAQAGEMAWLGAIEWTPIRDPLAACVAALTRPGAIDGCKSLGEETAKEALCKPLALLFLQGSHVPKGCRQPEIPPLVPAPKARVGSRALSAWVSALEPATQIPPLGNASVPKVLASHHAACLRSTRAMPASCIPWRRQQAPSEGLCGVYFRIPSRLVDDELGAGEQGERSGTDGNPDQTSEGSGQGGCLGRRLPEPGVLFMILFGSFIGLIILGRLWNWLSNPSKPWTTHKERPARTPMKNRIETGSPPSGLPAGLGMDALAELMQPGSEGASSGVQGSVDAMGDGGYPMGSERRADGGGNGSRPGAELLAGFSVGAPLAAPGQVASGLATPATSDGRGHSTEPGAHGRSMPASRRVETPRVHDAQAHDAQTGATPEARPEEPTVSFEPGPGAIPEVDASTDATVPLSQDLVDELRVDRVLDEHQAAVHARTASEVASLLDEILGDPESRARLVEAAVAERRDELMSLLAARAREQIDEVLTRGPKEGLFAELLDGDSEVAARVGVEVRALLDSFGRELIKEILDRPQAEGGARQPSLFQADFQEFIETNENELVGQLREGLLNYLYSSPDIPGGGYKIDELWSSLFEHDEDFRDLLRVGAAEHLEMFLRSEALPRLMTEACDRMCRELPLSDRLRAHLHDRLENEGGFSEELARELGMKLLQSEAFQAHLCRRLEEGLLSPAPGHPNLSTAQKLVGRVLRREPVQRNLVEGVKQETEGQLAIVENLVFEVFNRIEQQGRRRVAEQADLLQGRLAELEARAARSESPTTGGADEQPVLQAREAIQRLRGLFDPELSSGSASTVDGQASTSPPFRAARLIELHIQEAVENAHRSLRDLDAWVNRYCK